ISATTRMEAPTLSSLTAVSTTSQKLSWTEVSGAENYRVYQKVSGKWVRVGTTTKTSYTIKSLTTGTTYTYTVRACYTEDGTTMLGSFDQTGLSATCCPPAPVLSEAVSDTEGNITVTWEKVSGVTGYRIYRKTAGGSWKRIATVTGASTLSYTDTGLTSDTTYLYTVKAYKKVSGTNVWSSYDKTGVSATSVIAQPEQPTLVSAVCDSYGTVTVTWKKVSNATGYRVYRKVNGKWKNVSTRTTTSYTDTGLTYGESYTYTVKAYRKVNGNTVWGSCDKTGISCTVEVAAPVISAVNVSTAGQAKVRWKSVSGVSGYRVYYKQAGGKWTAVGNVGSSATTKTITGLESGTNYYFAVRSYWKVDGTTYFSSYTKTKKARTIK
ncbi:MAG: fibronectin type III domain-containing protein, partial [Lachnospiraceae bacterium]|nr:fibronectin type III domain-containing protein [Lachnospiraceae bacterium]